MVISWRLVSRINVGRKSIKEVQWIQIYFCSGYRSWPWRSVWGRPPSVSTWVTVVRAQIWRIKPVGTMNYQEQWDRRPGNLQQKAPTSLWPVSCVWLLVTRWLLSAKPLCPWDFPGKNTWVGCHSLLQGILATRGSNPGLLHCRKILYHLSHQGSPNH